MISPDQALVLLRHYMWVQVEGQVWCSPTTGGVLTVPTEVSTEADLGRMSLVELHLADAIGCDPHDLDEVAARACEAVEGRTDSG